MKALGCARAWQAEAIEDGRLSEADAASFKRHADNCNVCARELRLLASLRHAADHLVAFESTPLERRRMRNELLRRANEVAVRSPGSALPLGNALPPRAFAAALALVTVVAAVLLWFNAGRFNAGPPPSPVVEGGASAGVPTFRVSAPAGAEWRTLERGPTVRLSIRRGTFHIAVNKLRAEQRFLLDLPDGRLEVKGTEFVVTADGTRTVSASVSEGRVALRLRGREPLALGAGEAWTAEEVASDEGRMADAPAATGSVAPAAQSEKHSPSKTRAAAESVRPRVTREEPAAPGQGQEPAAAPEQEPAAPEPGPARAMAEAVDSEEQVQEPVAGSDFAAAMSAFSAGDYGRAERLFLEFQQTHPGDARVEDAMFLRAVARSRRGDASGARSIAREYLRRFPEGLRKVEAERLTSE